jgi:thioredoxin 1
MENFYQILDAESLVLVDFYAEWCGPCKAMEPEVNRFAEKYTGKIKVLKIDVEKSLELALKYEVRGVPTFVLFKNKEVVWKEPGVLSCVQLEKILEEYSA